MDGDSDWDWDWDCDWDGGWDRDGTWDWDGDCDWDWEADRLVERRSGRADIEVEESADTEHASNHKRIIHWH